MAIIDAIKTFIATYSGLETGAALLTNQLGKEPTQYSVDTLPGARIVETYLNDATLREYPFALTSMESTASEIDRLSNSGFYEGFAEWLDDQTAAGTLPNLGTGKTSEKIEALGWGVVLQDGESGTAIYQIQCKLTYEQQP